MHSIYYRNLGNILNSIVNFISEFSYNKKSILYEIEKECAIRKVLFKNRIREHYIIYI